MFTIWARDLARPRMRAWKVVKMSLTVSALAAARRGGAGAGESRALARRFARRPSASMATLGAYNPCNECCYNIIGCYNLQGVVTRGVVTKGVVTIKVVMGVVAL